MTNLNFRTLRTLEFFFGRTANAKKSIFILLFAKCIYLQLLKKLALYDNSLSRKKYVSDARGQNEPPLVVLGLNDVSCLSLGFSLWAIKIEVKI